MSAIHIFTLPSRTVADAVAEHGLSWAYCNDSVPRVRDAAFVFHPGPVVIDGGAKCLMCGQRSAEENEP